MKAIFAGTFDPFTLGHLDIVKRASSLFDEVIIAVAEETGKPTRPLKTRVEIAKLSVAGLDNLCVEPFSGLLTDFVKARDGVILRALRNGADFEYERELETVYKSISDAECVYLIGKYSHISSTTVRRLAALGADISGYVADNALLTVKREYGKQI